MDDDLKFFEAELQRLRPVRPSAALRARVHRELEPAPGRLGRNPGWWAWLALPAAAAALLLFNLQWHAPPASDANVRPSPAVTTAAAGGDTLKPVAAENVLYAATDEGLVTLDDGTPARRERLHFVDTITWRNPRTNASLTWSVPREEVRIVPVNFQ
jgi:hypothetical protein